MAIARLSRRVALVSAGALALFTAAGPAAGAASSGDLAGFGATAVASGASAVYYDPGAPVPATPTAELDAAFTRAALQSGPIGRSLASSAWPGDLVAGVGPALGLLLPVNPGVSAYPVRAQASYPQGEAKQENTSVPGNTMAASAQSSGVDARATSAGVQGGAAVVQGALVSSVHQEVVSSVVKVTGEARASDVSILDGLVTIGSVSSQASVQSDPAQKPQGATSVVGLAVGGIPMTIDGGGVHVSGGGPDASPVTVTAQSVLDKAGVTLVLGQPTDFADSGYTERLAGGLVVGIDAKALGAFINALPADAAKQLTTVINPQQTLYLSFGTVDVSVRTVRGAGAAPSVLSGVGPLAGGTPSATSPSFGAPTAAVRAGGLGQSAVAAATGVARATEPATADLAFAGAPAPTAESQPVALASEPAAYGGIPAGDVWIAALAVLAAASLVWRLTKALLAAAAGGPGCELE